MSALLVLGMCVGCTGSSFDREQAIDDVLASSGGSVTRDQAACYVDRVHDELGASALRPDATLAPAEVGKRTAIRIDCIGIANLGTEVPAVSPSNDDPSPEPVRGNHGDDPRLDALWDACAAGYGGACDQLFDAAPLGSAYEAFAATCGERSRELRCADIYPAPGTVNPSPAQPPQ